MTDIDKIKIYICDKLCSKLFTVHTYNIGKSVCIMIDYGVIGSVIIGQKKEEKYKFMYNVILDGTNNYFKESEPNGMIRFFYSPRELGKMLSDIYNYRRKRIQDDPYEYYSNVSKKKKNFEINDLRDLLERGKSNRTIYGLDYSKNLFNFFLDDKRIENDEM
mgnify:CR=1 FL=1